MESGTNSEAHARDGANKVLYLAWVWTAKGWPVSALLPPAAPLPTCWYLEHEGQDEETGWVGPVCYCSEVEEMLN